MQRGEISKDVEEFVMGQLIQDRDIDNVPSKRRNPVVADIFSRLDYMERRGSGFKKIMQAYEVEPNYTEDKKPVFIQMQLNSELY